jgi:hypothetical protein
MFFSHLFIKFVSTRGCLIQSTNAITQKTNGGKRFSYAYTARIIYSTVKNSKTRVLPKICRQPNPVLHRAAAASLVYVVGASLLQQVTKMKMLLGVTALLLVASVVRAVPSGFTERTIFEDPRMNDLSFTSDERMFVIQKMGLVSIREPGVNYQYEIGTTVLDIVEIVCEENERGLGGLALHPNFDSNGWM